MRLEGKAGGHTETPCSPRSPLSWTVRCTAHPEARCCVPLIRHQRPAPAAQGEPRGAGGTRAPPRRLAHRRRGRGRDARAHGLRLRTLTARFRQVIWVPGNHELWTLPREQPPLRGEARYQQLVASAAATVCSRPEDPYPRWPGEGRHRACWRRCSCSTTTPSGRTRRPQDEALEWAPEDGRDVHRRGRCSTRTPTPPGQAWCRARVERDPRAAGGAARATARTILINHFPLRYEHVRLPRIPRFSHLVRHAPHRGLAPALPRGGGRVRPPAHARHAVARRRALRGGLARLPPAVDLARRHLALPPGDIARRPALTALSGPRGPRTPPRRELLEQEPRVLEVHGLGVHPGA